MTVDPAVPGRLGVLLEQVMQGEPELVDEVDAVFRCADGLRRRRTRLVLVAGVAAVGAIVLIGYLLTTTLLPARGAPATHPVRPSRSVVAIPSAFTDPVLAVIAPVVDGNRMRIVPRTPARGFGWRQYSVLDHEGRSRGTIQVAVYAPSDTSCFPDPAHDGGCTAARHARDGIDYVRYDATDDPDWQVSQTIARRAADGRTVAVMATGERGAADADAARPPLTGTQVEQIATNVRLISAFGSRERCDGSTADACPVFRVPVSTAD